MSRIPLLIPLAILLLAGCSQQSGTGTGGGPGGGSGGGTDPDPNLPTTGIPDLDSMSISVDEASIEGFSRDNVTTTITVNLADRLNQDTVDGTEVHFSSEAGRIDQFCTVQKGSCTVTLSSSGDRTGIPDGLVTILAWTTGNESFLDQDSDGLYSDGDFFNDDPSRPDLAEPFLDKNFDGNYDAGSDEFSGTDFNQNGVHDGPDGKYNGVFCSHSTDCSTNQYLFIWKDLQVVFSSSSANITLNPDPVVPGQVTLTVTDINGNPMAVGTKIAIETDNGEVDVTSFTVGTDFGTSTILNVGTDGTPDTTTFRVTATSPESGLVTSYTTTFTD
ncbi:MAG TPA: hypothetical protein VFX02_02205 [Gammaproteobacteria bacterium]|nr:hypothetical protein [Gammaproteobacteria bacterium]